MDTKDTTSRRTATERRAGREAIRRDSQLALGCGFAFALLVVAALILVELAA